MNEEVPACELTSSPAVSTIAPSAITPPIKSARGVEVQQTLVMMPDSQPEIGLSDDEPKPVSDIAAAEAANRAASESNRSATGFDTLIGKIVVERGLVSADELQQCAHIARSRTEANGFPVSLTELLLENEYVTKRQIDRLRTDLEAVRSTQQIPGYQIIRKLGAGAMATVFLAKQLSLDRFVAIKVLPKKFSSNQTFIDRFYREGRAAARLNDANIVGALDVGQAGEHHYFVMEYVDGETLHDRILERKRIPEREALVLIRQVASALKHAHEMGFVHRDIKPKNIMLTKSGVAKLADLGLARAMSDREAAEAEAGRAFGTPYYISPEQIRGAVEIGPPADLYGLGATFYHMLTGRVPFDGTTPSQVMHKHLKVTPTPPDHINTSLSEPTALIVEMMLRKDPRDRYQTANELLIDLDCAAAGRSPEYARAAVDLAKLANDTAPTGDEATSVRRIGTPVSVGFIVLVAVAVISVILNLALVAALVL
ncbi:MAG: serine/threonine protein kinase [Phycisphaerales bacterium]|nr:serine/threonine protein kinase [Phycisphaerales bacterium]